MRKLYCRIAGNILFRGGGSEEDIELLCETHVDGEGLPYSRGFGTVDVQDHGNSRDRVPGQEAEKGALGFNLADLRGLMTPGKDEGEPVSWNDDPSTKNLFKTVNIRWVKMK